jgi:hypothetical protein
MNSPLSFSPGPYLAKAEKVFFGFSITTINSGAIFFKKLQNTNPVYQFAPLDFIHFPFKIPNLYPFFD